MKEKLNMEPKRSVAREKIQARANLLEDVVIQGVMVIAGTEIKVLDFGASDDPVHVAIEPESGIMLTDILVTALPRDTIMMDMTDHDWIFELNSDN